MHFNLLPKTVLFLIVEKNSSDKISWFEMRQIIKLIFKKIKFSTIKHKVLEVN